MVINDDSPLNIPSSSEDNKLNYSTKNKKLLLQIESVFGKMIP